ncbi:MAG TPA: glycoside hydrolase family 15 protein, partial [Pyrinomonadaceae bacterium]|nr:glycoside hydrolase family 15 protein [Pyrinomonadaceae bacterium]
AKSGAYTITKTYTTDTERATLLIDVKFQNNANADAIGNGDYSLYVYFDPSLNNSGMHDSAWTENGALLASDADKSSALLSSVGFDEMTNGFLGRSDGLTELRSQGGRLKNHYQRATDGNVVQVARVRGGGDFTLALGFGKNSDEALSNVRASLSKGFARCRSEYESGWHDYLTTLRGAPAKYRAQYNMAAMELKAHEDKTYRGAMIASFSIPWGGGPNANEATVGGYHNVWARDLYEVATAFIAMGDREGASRALDYLFKIQQKPDGSFPQNSWLDGRPFGGGLQMDEVAYPLVLAHQLGRADGETWTRHVKTAADFIVLRGPGTDQERWEEESGYSPSTIGAEIAGLVCAAQIAKRNHDEASAQKYLTTADNWERNLERWTATGSGKYGDGHYYLRLSGNDNPDDGEPEEINSNGGTYDEREVVDAGFLELVRLGIRRADDPLVIKSLAVVDSLIKVETPHGTAWYRYNHDAYGERADGGDYDARHGAGRLWALLTGERGEYEIARGRFPSAAKRLDAMMGFANEGMMIPEQVWDRPDAPSPNFRFGEGTGSATPLAWSMAQFVRLVINLEERHNVETPGVVAARYLKRRRQG